VGARARPQLSVVLPSFSPDHEPTWQPLLDLVAAAEEAGVDRLVVPDHVVFGEHLEAYGRPEVGGRKGAAQPAGSDGEWLEPMTTLAVIAGRTSRIRLGTAVLLAALRRPVVLAKQVATLDVLSGGRLDLGVGVGWQREEYEAAGLSFEHRGRLLDHALEVCQLFWRESRASYSSPELTFEAIHMMPKPAQPGGLPIWVSGTVTSRVATRIARFGSGWIPWGPAAEDVVPAIRRMWELVSQAGRDPTGLQVVSPLPVIRDGAGAVDPDRTLTPVARLAGAGVTDFRVRLDWRTDHQEACLELSRLVSAFGAVAS
jgi:probable F420-dependent oxidoreductase